MVGGTVEGDGARRVTAMQSLEAAGPEHLSFLANRRYMSAARQTKAGGVLVGPGTVLEGIDRVVVADPYRAFARIMQHWHPSVTPDPGVDSRAYHTRSPLYPAVWCKRSPMACLYLRCIIRHFGHQIVNRWIPVVLVVVGKVVVVAIVVLVAVVVAAVVAVVVVVVVVLVEP